MRKKIVANNHQLFPDSNTLLQCFFCRSYVIFRNVIFLGFVHNMFDVKSFPIIFKELAKIYGISYLLGMTIEPEKFRIAIHRRQVLERVGEPS